MKKIIFAAFTIISILGCKAQNNTIQYNEVTINNYALLNKSTFNLTQNLGTPVNIEPYFFEMEDIEGSLYKYHGANFYIINDKVNSFEIMMDNYNFTQHNIKVNNTINTLENIYPLTYINRGTDYLTIDINECDCFISIHYNSENNKIKKIRIEN